MTMNETAAARAFFTAALPSYLLGLLQDRSDDGEEIVMDPLLRDKRARPAAGGSDSVLIAIFVRHHHHTGTRQRILDQTRRDKTVQPWQPLVHDHDIRMLLLGHGDGIISRRRLSHNLHIGQS